MAYLDLSESRGQAAAKPGHALAAGESRFSVLEWQVVAIARRDRLSTLAGRGWFSLLLGMIFGGERPNPRLADPKLEALRRLSVLAWHHGHALPRREVAAFHEAGYTAEQLATLLAGIGQGGGSMTRTGTSAPTR